MPKTISVLLRSELLRHNIELLDIYRFSNKDVVRVRDRASGRVIVYALKTPLSSVTSRDDLGKVVNEILGIYRAK